MIMASQIKRVLVAQYWVDFRKSFDGLCAESYRLGLNVIEGDVVLFISKNRLRLKILFCDKTGMWICSKRFHDKGMKAQMAFLESPQCCEISEGELFLLTEGTSFTVHKRIKTW